MIVVLDDVFDPAVLASYVSALPVLPTGDTWFERGSHALTEQILDVARRFFDLSAMAGYEMHVNTHTPYRHYDKDEVLYDTQGVLSFPLCGIVYYPVLENLVGGDLVFPEDGVSVRPQVNRLVMFSPDLLHEGVPHSGTRISIGVNPWRERPTKYR